jgi:hypothetical protein
MSRDLRYISSIIFHIAAFSIAAVGEGWQVAWKKNAKKKLLSIQPDAQGAVTMSSTTVEVKRDIGSSAGHFLDTFGSSRRRMTPA